GDAATPSPERPRHRASPEPARTPSLFDRPASPRSEPTPAPRASLFDRPDARSDRVAPDDRSSLARTDDRAPNARGDERAPNARNDDRAPLARTDERAPFARGDERGVRDPFDDERVPSPPPDDDEPPPPSDDDLRPPDDRGAPPPGWSEPVRARPAWSAPSETRVRPEARPRSQVVTIAPEERAGSGASQGQPIRSDRSAGQPTLFDPTPRGGSSGSGGPRASSGASTSARAPASARTVDERSPTPRGTAIDVRGSFDAPRARGSSEDVLSELLERTFRHRSFRPHQEEVCRTAYTGRDVLLVMPTGAGKSLCYQIPGLARGGTTLVVSPLIALMEDQVSKLKALGLRAERIHSGRARLDSRTACNDYLAGRLDFLFIAPERLAVPGFPEMLSRRTPSLIAIDEAHCISQWGHDFRPEYRMLGARLPILRPAPVMALTATATPVVQKDIADQLGLVDCRHYIHGFRRTNIAIEVVEVPKPERALVALSLLESPSRRPAILYASSRKDAESLAELIGAKYAAAAYHAGMTGSARDRVQTDFLSGRLEVIVATIAFGMGVDKADIRTVVHLALPQTVEGYYQEIGRAGRDGKPSRAILLHSYIDRRTHEYFLERNYPEVSTLKKIHGAVREDGEPRESLGKRLKIDADEFEQAVEKLWIHGGVTVDADDVVRPGHDRWMPSYVAQREHRAEQAQQMAHYAEVHGCRMLHLVRHFGDEADSGEVCGVCDVCAPGDCTVQPFRRPTEDEVEALGHIVEHLALSGSRAMGALHRELDESDKLGGIDRDTFEILVSGLSRAQLVDVESSSFEKDGKTISFQRVELTLRGRAAGERELSQLDLPSAIARSTRGKRRGKRDGVGGAKPKAARRRAAREDHGSVDAPEALVEALKAWRRAEALKKKIPAFRILTDRALLGIASERPTSAEQLLEIHGVGPKVVERYGDEIIALLDGA
ncbi:RecQ family ATP-dependent DNA helicase, partial [Myxococcota bacterium]|nr:RecQ family ATP-dependent DNA helicase [Myxococcota bacterium]